MTMDEIETVISLCLADTGRVIFFLAVKFFYVSTSKIRRM